MIQSLPPGFNKLINSPMDSLRVIRDYGEDKFAKNIAKHIVKAREKKAIETTGELNEIICSAIPAKMRAEGGGNPGGQMQGFCACLNAVFTIRSSNE